MSLSVDGFWRAGFWNTGFWADGFWFEGATQTVTETHGGVSKRGGGRKVIVRLSDVENRADTAEFLKSQLRIRHPDSAFTPDPQPEVVKKESASARRARERQAAAAIRAIELERAEAERQAELLAYSLKKRAERTEQEELMLLMLMAGAIA